MNLKESYSTLPPLKNSILRQELVHDMRPDSGYFQTWIRGAAYIRSPLGAALIGEQSPQSTGHKNDWRAWCKLVANETWSPSAGNEAAAHILESMIEDVGNTLTPQGLMRLREHYWRPMENKHRWLLDRQVIRQVESRLAPDAEEDMTLKVLLAKYPTYLEDARFLFGPDTGWRKSYVNLGREAYARRALENRLLLRELQQEGLLNAQDRERLADLGLKVLGRVWHKLYSDGLMDMGRISALFVWDGTLSERVTRDSKKFGYISEDGAAYKPDVAERRSGSGKLLMPDGTEVLPVMPVLTQLAAEGATLMEKAGWVDPKTYFDFPLRLIHLGLEAAGSQPWINRERHMRYVISHFLTKTLPGKVIEQTERLCLQLAADRNFHKFVAENNLPLTNPEQTGANTYRTREAYPENLIVGNMHRRSEMAAGIRGDISMVTDPGRYGERSFIESTCSLAISNRRPIGDESSGDIRTREERFKEVLTKALDLAAEYVRVGTIPAEMQALAGVLAGQLELLGRPAFEHSSGGFYGDYFKSLIRRLRSVAKDNNKLVANSFALRHGEPMVVLGENGGGKSTVMAIIMQQHLADGPVVAAQAVFPAGDLEVVGGADRVELEGRKRIWSGRAENKSSFMLEVETMITRIKALLKRPSGNPFLEVGDEVGRRTDQLNGMALLGAEIAVAAKKQALSINASHFNSMMQTFSPLFERAGVHIHWATMRDFKLVEVGPDEVVRSNAYENAVGLVPKNSGEAWSAVRGGEVIEYGQEYRERTYDQMHQERLAQIGWLKNQQSDTQVNVSGGAATILGLDYTSKMRSNRFAIRNQDRLFVQTLLNPQWELGENVPGWLDKIGADRKTFTSNTDALDKIGSLYFDIQAFLQGREFEPKAEEGLKKRIEALAEKKEAYCRAASEAQQCVPGLPLERLIPGIRQLNNDSSMQDFAKLFRKEIDQIVLASSLGVMEHNLASMGVCRATRMQEEGIRLKQAWGWELASMKKGQENVKKNDIEVNQTIIFTGPQGSGKTEALFMVAENAMALSLWGRAFAAAAEIGPKMIEVLPLISVPDFKDSPAVFRPLSSLESEACNRMGMISQFVSEMPAGKVPLVIVDEPFSSTNTGDASEGTRAVHRLIDQAGGWLVAATHSHEAVWDMERTQTPFSPMHVGLFSTPDAYRLFAGHGDSLGIEVAHTLGMPESVNKVAVLLRDFILATKSHPQEFNELVEAYAPRLSALLKNI